MSIDTETAKRDFENWLDYKKIRPTKREEHASEEDTIIDCMKDEILTIDEEFNIKHKLIFPILDKDGNEVVSELTYMPRLNHSLLKSALKPVKPGDMDGRVTAHIAALTKQNSGLIDKLDTEDRNIASAIAFYFL